MSAGQAAGCLALADLLERSGELVTQKRRRATGPVDGIAHSTTGADRVMDRFLLQLAHLCVHLRSQRSRQSGDSVADLAHQRSDSVHIDSSLVLGLLNGSQEALEHRRGLAGPLTLAHVG